MSDEQEESISRREASMLTDVAEELAKKAVDGVQSLAKAVGWRGRKCHPDEQEGRLWGQRMC